MHNTEQTGGTEGVAAEESAAPEVLQQAARCLSERTVLVKRHTLRKAATHVQSRVSCAMQ